jgi:hypothetical protein
MDSKKIVKKIENGRRSILKKTEAGIVDKFKTVLNESRAELVAQAEKGALNQDGIVKYDRLNKMVDSIDDIIDDVWDEVEDDIVKAQVDTYKNTFFEAAAYWTIFMATIKKTEPKQEIKEPYNVITNKQVKAGLDDTFNGFDIHPSIEKWKIDMRAGVRRGIISGIKNGESVPEISRRIKEIMNIETKRALTIARTETHRAMSLSHLDYQDRLEEEAEKYGYKLVKHWSAAIDDRTRSFDKGDQSDHIVMDGVAADEEGMFHVPTTSGDDIMAAPGLGTIASANINCRCAFYNELVEVE